MPASGASRQWIIVFFVLMTAITINLLWFGGDKGPKTPVQKKANLLSMSTTQLRSWLLSNSVASSIESCKKAEDDPSCFLRAAMSQQLNNALHEVRESDDFAATLSVLAKVSPRPYPK